MSELQRIAAPITVTIGVDKFSPFNSSFFKFYSSEETTVKNDEIWRTRPPAGWTTA